MDWGKAATLVAIVFLGLWNGYKEWVEWRVRKTIKNVTGLDLSSNPERCADHEKRLRGIEQFVPAWEERFRNIADDIAEIKRKVNGK